MNYIGTCGGAEFDRSLGGYPFEFTLGEGKVVKGWDVALRTMAVGESADLILAPEYG